MAAVYRAIKIGSLLGEIAMVAGGALLLYWAAGDLAHRLKQVVGGVALIGMAFYLAPLLLAWRCRPCRRDLEESFLTFPRSKPPEIEAILAAAKRGENIEGIHLLHADAKGDVLALQVHHCPACRRTARVCLGTYETDSEKRDFHPKAAPVILTGDVVRVLLL